MTNQHSGKWITTVIVLATVVSGIGYLLQLFKKPELPEGIVSGNGRIEAIEVDITTKYGGRIVSITVAPLYGFLKVFQDSKNPFTNIMPKEPLSLFQ